MAVLDHQYTLVAVVEARSGGYAITERDLDGHLVPKRPTKVTPEQRRQSVRGIAHTRSPLVYLFRYRAIDTG